MKETLCKVAFKDNYIYKYDQIKTWLEKGTKLKTVSEELYYSPDVKGYTYRKVKLKDGREGYVRSEAIST